MHPSPSKAEVVVSRPNPAAPSEPSVPQARLRLLGISGSLREESLNTALLRAAQDLAPEDVEVVIHPLHGVPLYDGDVEDRGFPDAVVALRDAMASADGLLVAAPEYNHSISGVLKNAIDWASRRPDPPLDHKPTALLSAAGGSGGQNAQRHLRDVLAHNQVQVIDDAVQIKRARHHIEQGRLETPEFRQAVADLLGALRERVLDVREGSADESSVA